VRKARKDERCMLTDRSPSGRGLLLPEELASYFKKLVCPASTISSPRRQLFLPTNDNYFLTRRAERSARPRRCFLRDGSGRWESGKPAFGFLTFPSALVAGAVGMWESRLLLARFPRGLWKEGEACLWLSTLPTDPAFPQLAFLPRRRFRPPRFEFPPVVVSWRVQPGSSGCSTR
jgi:hypothetical protein